MAEGGGLTRALHPYEQICKYLNIAIALEVRGQGITADAFQQAIHMAAKEHPYLRLSIVERNGTASFVEQPIEKLCCSLLEDANLPVERLQQLVNQPRTDNRALHSAEISILSDGSATLYLLFNHAGIDGPGVFQVAASIADYLGRILSGEAVSEPAVRRQFVDIFSRVPPHIEEIPKIQAPADILGPPKPIKGQLPELKGIQGINYELSRTETAALVQRCREHGASVQGAVSAAALVASLKILNATLPAVVGVQAPANQRSQVSPPVAAEDCVCGSAALWWSQEVAAETRLWDVVATCTAKLRQALADKAGLAWWHWLQKEFYAPPFTVMASSIGVCPVQSQYGSLAVEDVHFQGGSYGLLNPEEANTMTHAYTFDGRLKVVASAAQPMLGRQRAEAMAAMQEKVLRLLADSQSPDCAVGALVAGQT